MLLHTHTLIWAMLAPDLLSIPAREALSTAPERCASAARLYEITVKAMPGKWPMRAHLVSFDLDARLRADGFEVLPASGAIMQRAGGLDWAQRDLLDRIIAAMAALRDLAVASKDATLNSIPGFELRRI